jgi:ferredoxin-NADP reductase
MVVSVRRPGDLYYSDELPGAETAVVYTREAPEPAGRPVGRLMSDDLARLVRSDAIAYICGSSGFADHASNLLVELGVPIGQIRVERFGPTG